MTALRGTWRLVRLILRRDRWVLPLWVVLAALIPTSFAAQFAGLYPTAAERQEFFTVSAGNAGFTALYGRLLGPSLGELVTWRVGFVPMVVGLFSLLTVVRHTRAEEEAGRRELVGAAVVGRHAPLAAALVAAVAANVALAVLVALGVTSQDLPAAGSWALGLEFAAAGWVFAAVGAVAAQLTSSAGAARGIAVSTLGAAFVLRMAGDLSAGTGGGWGWTSWLSPIGLVQRIHPYSGEGWGVLVIAVAGTGVLAAAAVALSARRDLGAGVLPARSEPAAAAPALCSPLALAWRLHRTGSRSSASSSAVWRKAPGTCWATTGTCGPSSSGSAVGPGWSTPTSPPSRAFWV